jgi:hypothetical protein
MKNFGGKARKYAQTAKEKKVRRSRVFLNQLTLRRWTSFVDLLTTFHAFHMIKIFLFK